jgi:hypothetical protein
MRKEDGYTHIHTYREINACMEVQGLTLLENEEGEGRFVWSLTTLACFDSAACFSPGLLLKCVVYLWLYEAQEIGR